MEIIQKTSEVNTTESKNRDIQYIVIHYTAGLSSEKGRAASTATYFSKESTKASADFIVDDETIVQYNPDIKNRYAWSCGGSKLKTKGGSLYGKCNNKNSINVEICSNNTTGKIKNANDESWYFTDEAVLNAIDLVRHLIDEYGVAKENVIRHYDVTGKLCPGIIGWNEESGDESEWDSFKAAVAVREDSVDDFGETTENYQELLEKYNALKAKYDAIIEIINN